MLKRSLGADLAKMATNVKCAENATTAKAWGSHGRHLGCFKSLKTSSFFLHFSELTLLAFFSKAMSSSFCLSYLFHTSQQSWRGHSRY
jgi:hypothetical protein